MRNDGSTRQFKLYDVSRNSDVPQEEVDISTPDELRSTLLEFKKRERSVFELIAPNRDLLVLGVGGDSGYVMFQSAEADPPYLWALGPNRDFDHYIEFLMEGTPTPVPIARTIPFHEMVDIATSWMQNGRLPDTIEWDED